MHKKETKDALKYRVSQQVPESKKYLRIAKYGKNRIRLEVTDRMIRFNSSVYFIGLGFSSSIGHCTYQYCPSIILRKQNKELEEKLLKRFAHQKYSLDNPQTNFELIFPILPIITIKINIMW